MLLGLTSALKRYLLLFQQIATSIRSVHGEGGVIAVETAGKDKLADRLRTTVQAMNLSPTTGALPFTSGYPHF